MAIPEGPQVRTVTTSFGQVRVRDTAGGGRPLLLVHSALVDPDLYARLVPLLADRGYRCVVPELPLGGHLLPLRDGADLTPTGLARLLVEVLDGLDLPTVSVVGVDTGGALTQILMAEHRDRVDAVILTACDAYDDFPPKIFRPILAPMKLPGGLAVAAVVATRFRFVRRLFVPRMVTHHGVDDATLLRWTTPLRNPLVRRDLRAVLTTMHPRYTLAAANANKDFPRPVLIAWGDDDRAFSRRLGEQLHRDLPRSRLVTIPDCAAFAALDQPEALAGLIDNHLADSNSRIDD